MSAHWLSDEGGKRTHDGHWSTSVQGMAAAISGVANEHFWSAIAGSTQCRADAPAAYRADERQDDCVNE